MNVEITDVNSTRKKMKVVVPKEEVIAVTGDIYKDIAQKASIKGFRKGKAPRNVIKMYYSDFIESELVKKLVNDKFEEAIKESNVFVVSMPDFENDPPKENEEFAFTAEFDVKPEVTVQKYSGFELKKQKVSVGDEDINDVLTRLRENYSTINEIEDPEYKAAKGDYVIVDITCEENPDLNRENMTIEAGVRSAFPDLEEAVIGMKAAEEKEADIKFPDEHFLEDMRGKSAHIKMTVSSIKHRKLPELDDEFAKKARQGVENMEDLKKIIAEDLTKRMEAEVHTSLERQIQDKLLEENAIEVPDSMVRLQAGMMIQGMSQRLNAQGIRLEDVYSDPQAFRDETMASAEKLTKTSLIIEAIAKEQKIEATDEDVDEEIKTLAERYNMEPEIVKKGLEERGSLDEMKFGILEKKVYDYIIENSEVTEIDKMEEEPDDASADSSGADE